MAFNSSVQFIDVPLNAADKKKLVEWFSSHADGDQLVETLIRQGYKVSVSWDKRNSCFSAFLMPMSEDSPNTGCILTARSDDWWKALMSLYYKHTVVMKGDWRPMKRKDSDFLDF